MRSSKGIIKLDSFNSSSEIDEINITSDESMFGLKSDSMVESILNEQKMVKYDVMINRTNNYHFPEISFDDIDKYDFKNKGFIEVIKSPDYVHLYFDFDSMLTLEEKQREKDNKLKGINEIIVNNEEQMKRLDGVIQWLDLLKSIFGDYTIGGYTNNKDVNEKYQFRLYLEGNHFISMHVVFYQTMLEASELEEIMKHTMKSGFIYDGINRFADPNVYALVKNDNGKGGTQKFRHVLSDKIFTTNKDDKYCKSNKFNNGVIINDLKPSTQIIQARGDEKIVSRDEWSKVFKQQKLKEARNETKITTSSKRLNSESVQSLIFDADDLVYVSKRIELNDDEFYELFSNFEPTHTSLNSFIMSFLHLLFDKERVRDILSQWYNKIEHNNERTLDDYVDKYYQQEDNNKWFYSLVNHIDDDEIRNHWIDIFKYHDIDEEAKIIVKDELGISEIYNTDYRLNGGIGVNITKFLNDLKHVVVAIALSRPLFIVKDYDSLNKSYSLSYLGLNEFKTLMETFNLGKYYKDGKFKDVNG